MVVDVEKMGRVGLGKRAVVRMIDMFSSLL